MISYYLILQMRKFVRMDEWMDRWMLVTLSRKMYWSDFDETLQYYRLYKRITLRLLFILECGQSHGQKLVWHNVYLNLSTYTHTRHLTWMSLRGSVRAARCCQLGTLAGPHRPRALEWTADCCWPMSHLQPQLAMKREFGH